MKTLKEYKVIIQYSHESYNGYDHNDGNKEIVVKACNIESAKKKALVLDRQCGGGYHRKIREVRNLHSNYDWIMYG